MRRLAWLFLAFTMISCTTGRDPIIVSPFPTATFSPQPPTLTPTIVREPTSTPVPTEDPFAITVVSVDGPTATSPLGPTFTPAPPTQTFTPAPTLIGLEIEYFTTSNDSIAPGDNVTLFWLVRGAEDITIYLVTSEGDRENPRPVEAEGSITLSTEPTTEDTTQFVLVAEAEGFTIEETLDIDINCDGEWFFTPAPGGCPSDVSIPGAHAEQAFQNGLMIWSSLTNEIFIFYTDNEEPRWQRLADNYTEGLPDPPVDLTAPDGLLLPVRGFGLVWRTNPTMQSRLGFALTSEVGYAGVVQTGTNTDGEAVLYLRRENGEVLQLLADGSNWQTIVPESITESE